MPYLSYHLETAEICLFSPQIYHTLCSGHSKVHGDRVVKSLDDLQIEIPIDSRAGNVPMIQSCACSQKEIQDMGPHVCSALPHFERKQDLLGSWSESNFANWGIDSGDELVSRFGLRSGNVGVDANINLSSAQKELLLWHLKLGVSM